MLRRLFAVLAAAVALAGCGTVVFTNSFSVSVTSAAGTEVEVSVFDPYVGDTRDWAERSLGTATEGQPYTQDLNTTGTKVIGDNSPPTRVTAGLYLPQINDSGYFAIAFDPVPGESVDYAAGFVPFSEGQADPLPLILTAVTTDNGWDVDIEVLVPTA